MPTLKQAFSILLNQLLYSLDLSSTKAAAVLQSYWIEPRFGSISVAFNMDVRRLIAIPGVKEKSIWACS